MRRSVLFFTFLLSTAACGAEPATRTETDELGSLVPIEARSTAPPAAADIGDAPMEGAGSLSFEHDVTKLRPVSQGALVARPARACPSPHLCDEATWHRSVGER